MKTRMSLLNGLPRQLMERKESRTMRSRQSCCSCPPPRPLTSDRNLYLATLKVLLKNGVEIPQGVKTKIMAAAWARGDHAVTKILLMDFSSAFTLVELLKALTMLDAGRRLREKERHLRQLQVLIQDKRKIRRKTMSKVKSDIDNLTVMKPKVGSVSGALCRHIRRWVRGLSGSQLEFYALHYPKEPWKKLADICHLNPSKDFPEKPWFLPFCFGEPAPDGSLVAQCSSMSAENINELVKGADIPYSHIKEFTSSLTNESKVRIATYEDKVDTLLWYYEDLNCSGVDEVIIGRLDGGEPVRLPSAKLMERLLMMKTRGIGSTVLEKLLPEAEKRLGEMKVYLEAPVAILGDRSPSMSVAIKTSTIIAALLTAITDAKLSFFTNVDYVPPSLPKTMVEVLEMATQLKTDGCTIPAASLWPYYERKEIIKTFVVVTDEEENGQSHGLNFQQLFKKYQEEVYADVKIVFISFLSQTSSGKMVSQLISSGVKPMQFKFSHARPDLTKFDNILGTLSSLTNKFKEDVRKEAAALASEAPGQASTDASLISEAISQASGDDGQTSEATGQTSEATGQASKGTAQASKDEGQASKDTAQASKDEGQASS